MKHTYSVKSIKDLIPYANNSRDHSEEQVNQIASSIKEFGFTNPVLIDEDGGIIAGHGRVMGAKKLSLTEVPCIVLTGLTEAQKKAYIIADNQLPQNASWNEEMLRLELESLQEFDFDLDLLGFEEDFLGALLDSDVEEGLTDEDHVPELPIEPVSVEGDVWLLGDHRVMCGDSTSVDAVELLMDGKKADMIFTDPPYGVDYKGINNDSRDGLASLLSEAFSNYFINSKSGASIYCFHSDRCADIFHTAFREFFHFSSMIIWNKNSLTLSQTDYQSKHEPCLYGWMNNGSHTFYGDRKQLSVWDIPKETVKGHTTPKPIEVVSMALNNSSKGGDLILDLFGGSGSTLIASEKNNRSSNLMELDPKYVDVIITRWQDFTGKEATLEKTGDTFNALKEAKHGSK